MMFTQLTFMMNPTMNLISRIDYNANRIVRNKFLPYVWFEENEWKRREKE